MEFSPPLKPAILIKRYKRFLADVTLENGSQTTIHCANTGAMTGCGTPGDTIWYSTSDNPKRKYPCSWELTETQQGDWIGINTQRPNALVEAAIKAGEIPRLAGYAHCQREVCYGEENSRIDLLLSNNDSDCCYVEVKSVTLLENGKGYFPDTKSVRGQKHLRELMAITQKGHRAVLLFAVMHTGIRNVRPAHHIDPAYGELMEQAASAGVEVISYAFHACSSQIHLHCSIPFHIR
jgi:sugar fermentation stimulation protein A